MHQKIHSLYVDIFLPFSFFLSIIQFYYTLIISFLIKTQLLTVKVVDKRHKFYNNFRKLLFQFSRTLPDNLMLLLYYLSQAVSSRPGLLPVHQGLQILLERYVYSEIGGTSILI